MKVAQVEAKQIQVGDRVLDKEGNPVTITEITKGMPRNTLELRWRGGWSAVRPDMILERVV